MTRIIFINSATSGARLGTIYINGAHSQDWEDIACGPCTGGSGNCVYIGDTGGNAGGDANTIYRIREPSSIHDQSVNVDGVLEFRYGVNLVLRCVYVPFLIKKTAKRS